MSRTTLLRLACVAGVLTLLNAWKSLTIDDPLYHALAIHLASRPADPYGFTVGWYQSPQPAFDVLIAPALPYWLSIGVRLFGASPLACKLWLFPISALLVGALYSLFRRWASGLEWPLLVMTAFSAAILPSQNLMVDVPVLALSLGALALFARSVDRDRAWLAIAAGGLAGLATETKYSGLLAPLVLLLYAGTHRRWLFGFLAAAVAFSFFAAWELWMFRLYGDSTFHHHLGIATAGLWRKVALTLGLVTNLGGISAPVVLLGLLALGVPRPGLRAASGLLILGYVALAMAPGRSDWFEFRPLGWRFTIPVAIHVFFGLALVACLVAACVKLLRRERAEGRASEDTRFLLGWLLLEIVGYYAFSPFTAVRRVLTLFVVVTVLLGRLAARASVSGEGFRALKAVAVCGVVFGGLVYAIDARDADSARLAVERARERVGGSGATVWYTGHWGFQHYAERAGMRAVVPGASRLERGDWLLIPDARIDQQHISLPEEHLDPAEPVEITDFIPFATVGNYYTSPLPLRPLRGPRFRLFVYRVRDDFVAKP